LVKLTRDGIVEWQRAYGAPYTGGDNAHVVIELANGDLAVAGATLSFGAGNRDYWLMRLSPYGEIVWQRAYGGSSDEYPWGLAETPDQGLIVVGRTFTAERSWDMLIIRLDGDGEVIWHKTYGGPGSDSGSAVAALSGGGFIVVGDTTSYGHGMADAWVVALAGDGSILWQNAYGGAENDFVSAITRLKDGGIAIAGATDSSGSGSRDVWALCLDQDGEIRWQKNYGSSRYEQARSVWGTADGGLIIAGWEISSPDTMGAHNWWVARLTDEGRPIWQQAYGAEWSEQAYAVRETSRGYLVVGHTSSQGTGDYDYWIANLDLAGGSRAPMLSSTASMANTSTVPKSTSATLLDIPLTTTETDALATETNAEVVSN
jgi:hypothetical protein